MGKARQESAPLYVAAITVQCLILIAFGRVLRVHKDENFSSLVTPLSPPQSSAARHQTPSSAMPPRKKGTRGGKASASASKGRGSSTASTGAAAVAANDPLSAAGARWIVPNTVSLALGPSHSAGACVRRLFFDSREWVTPLRADVAALLAEFEARYDSQHSPIELMKLLWTETGWKWVLLLGCPAGKIRLDWGNSVARAFLGEAQRASVHNTGDSLICGPADADNVVPRLVSQSICFPAPTLLVCSKSLRSSPSTS